LKTSAAKKLKNQLAPKPQSDVTSNYKVYLVVDERGEQGEHGEDAKNAMFTT